MKDFVLGKKCDEDSEYNNCIDILARVQEDLGLPYE
jgi:hypothetical protein